METRYIEFYLLPGIRGLPSSQSVEILALGKDGARAFITLERDAYHLHMRRLKALGILFSEIFLPTKISSTSTDQFNRELLRSATKQYENDEALLVVEIIGREERLDMEFKVDHGDFCSRIQLFDEKIWLILPKKHFV